MEDQINKLINRLENLDREIALVELVDKAIVKTTFHFRARQFVTSLIKQREIILNHRASHKNPCQMFKAIDHLKVNLEATGQKDRPMARYFIIYEEEIRSLIPGAYPNKRFEDFIALRDQAREINSRHIPVL
jgi:hypothetical protein